MSKLMGHLNSYSFFVKYRVNQWVEEEIILTIGDETPIFHCARIEVRYGYLSFYKKIDLNSKILEVILLFSTLYSTFSMDIWRRNSPCKSQVCDTLRLMQIFHRHFLFALFVRSVLLVCCACSNFYLSSQNSTPQMPQGTWTFSPMSQIRPRAIHFIFLKAI